MYALVLSNPLESTEHKYSVLGLRSRVAQHDVWVQRSPSEDGFWSVIMVLDSGLKRMKSKDYYWHAGCRMMLTWCHVGSNQLQCHGRSRDSSSS